MLCLSSSKSMLSAGSSALSSKLQLPAIKNTMLESAPRYGKPGDGGATDELMDPTTELQQQQQAVDD
ncbi:hypothetical protein C5167_015236 [Papaver somniferum]|uniref:Uncharacterized protein n=1 Tax=Papaver somniferum TaxID=3469 RepID=A0A4Y7J9C2_PAPSO|nr:hypothetical protein C5167_015236 [Papaver somniferum]